MTEWKLEVDGDGREQRRWLALDQNFSNYEILWQLYVVPQTFRIMDRAVRWVRPGARWPEIADYNYAAFSHLAGAIEILEHDGDLEEPASIYAYTSRLYSATEAAMALVKKATELMGEYGGAQIPDRERWFRVAHKDEVWSSFENVCDRIGKYRNPHVHQVEIVRLGGRLPKPEHVESYKQLSRLAVAIASNDVVTEQFEPAVVILTNLYSDLVAAMDAVWGFILEQLAGLPDHERLIDELSHVTDEDRVVLAKLPRGDVPADSGSTRSMMGRPRSNPGQGSISLSAQGPEDLRQDWS